MTDRPKRDAPRADELDPGTDETSSADSAKSRRKAGSGREDSLAESWAELLGDLPESPRKTGSHRPLDERDATRDSKPLLPAVPGVRPKRAPTATRRSIAGSGSMPAAPTSRTREASGTRPVMPSLLRPVAAEEAENLSDNAFGLPMVTSEDLARLGAEPDEQPLTAPDRATKPDAPATKPSLQHPIVAASSVEEDSPLLPPVPGVRKGLNRQRRGTGPIAESNENSRPRVHSGSFSPIALGPVHRNPRHATQVYPATDTPVFAPPVRGGLQSSPTETSGEIAITDRTAASERSEAVRMGAHLDPTSARHHPTDREDASKLDTKREPQSSASSENVHDFVPKASAATSPPASSGTKRKSWPLIVGGLAISGLLIAVLDLPKSTNSSGDTQASDAGAAHAAAVASQQKVRVQKPTTSEPVPPPMEETSSPAAVEPELPTLADDPPLPSAVPESELTPVPDENTGEPELPEATELADESESADAEASDSMQASETATPTDDARDASPTATPDAEEPPPATSPTEAADALPESGKNRPGNGDRTPPRSFPNAKLDAQGQRIAPARLSSKQAESYLSIPVQPDDRAPLGGIGSAGVYVDKLVLGNAFADHRCTGETNQFSVKDREVAHVCLRVVHRGEVAQTVEVRWVKDKEVLRRRPIRIKTGDHYGGGYAKLVFAMQSDWVGADWALRVVSEDGVILYDAKFEVLP